MVGNDYIMSDLIFVYGSLLPGGYLSSAWEGHADALHDGECWVDGYELVAAEHGSFPYALPATGERVYGCLLRPHWLACSDYLLNDFDRIEGHPTHYRRTRVDVYVGVGGRVVTFLPVCVSAWMYVPAPRTELRLRQANLQTVPGGRWVQPVSEVGLGFQ